jgi:hypothetical protein
MLLAMAEKEKDRLATGIRATPMPVTDSDPDRREGER